MDIKIGDQVKLTRGITRNRLAVSTSYHKILRRDMTRKIWIIISTAAAVREDFIMFEIIPFRTNNGLHDEDEWGDPIWVHSKYVKKV